VQGDASSRSYERVVREGRKLILMNAPRRPDGPAVRGGLPYSAIAHLAEDVKPFVAMARALRERGLSAPEVYAADLNEGLLLLEDLGSEGVVAGDPPAPIEERYAAAVDVLVELHRQPVPGTLPVAPGVDYRLPPYDLDAFLIEAELLIDWYLPYRGAAVTSSARAEFDALWREALARAHDFPPTWVLRDYHSPNLLWLPEREGIARVGLIDFQDAVMGPAPYDLVSLLQDARVDVPDPMEIALLGRYVKARLGADPDFATTGFVQLYVTLGAQRATKILGIFARLDKRDGKPQYLRHIPRIWRYLRRALIHPAMTDLKAWYDAHVPLPPQ
jgi:aminoglycoside/choline kinase family phosphotransferase